MKALPLVAVLLLAWCMSTPKTTTTTTITTWTVTTGVVQTDIVKIGDTVKVDYVWRLEDGKVFDTSIASQAQTAWLFSSWRAYEPIEFTVGQRQMIEWFDEWVIGMKVWETKKLTIVPQKAYGDLDPKAIVTTWIAVFTAQNITPVIWETYSFYPYRWKVVAMSWSVVTVDFNHELAWKTLIFDVTVVSKK